MLSKKVNRIAIKDEVEVIMYFLEFGKGTINNFNSSKSIPIGGNVVRGNNLFDSIHHKESIMPLTTDFNVCFISADRGSQRIIKVINKRF